MAPQLLGQRATRLICNASNSCPKEPPLAERTSITVAEYGFAGLIGLQLPRWTAQGFLTNCSSSYAPPAVGGGEIPLAKCLVACLDDSKCDGVMVSWTQPHSWPKPASMPWFGNYVQCHLRGSTNLSTCDTDRTETHSMITISEREI